MSPAEVPAKGQSKKPLGRKAHLVITRGFHVLYLSPNENDERWVKPKKNIDKWDTPYKDSDGGFNHIWSLK